MMLSTMKAAFLRDHDRSARTFTFFNQDRDSARDNVT
jgi:hypothetical protein